MAQTKANLGRQPRCGRVPTGRDGAYDTCYIHEYFTLAGGFAAVPWADRKATSRPGCPPLNRSNLVTVDSLRLGSSRCVAIWLITRRASASVFSFLFCLPIDQREENLTNVLLSHIQIVAVIICCCIYIDCLLGGVHLDCGVEGGGQRTEGFLTLFKQCFAQERAEQM